MSVSCTTNDPHEAATLTNAVVDAYMAEIVDAEQETSEAEFADGLELVRQRSRMASGQDAG